MCGVFGIIGKEQIAEILLQGMSLLQHRGQDATGVFTYNPQKDTCALHNSHGLVNQVFPTTSIPRPEAAWGIGHLRYSTIGSGNAVDIQPHILEKQDYTIALIHNGNIVNYVPLKDKMMSEQTVFQTTCDTEIILHLFSNKLEEAGQFNFEAICSAVSHIYTHVFGSYSVLGIITGHGLIAFRDPWGFRPLLYGVSRDKQSHIFSSETGPFNLFEVENIQDIEPGEVIFIDKNNKVHRHKLKEYRHAHCSFEFNYFAKANSVIEKREVYQVRQELGLKLAKNVKEAGIEIDTIIPIPETARPSALALGRALHIPIDEGFIKQDYIGRTFIMPTQKIREKAVSKKITAVNSVFKGKKVLLVDDSIVRGTVCRHVIQLARKAGATHVYFASTYPPIRHPCFYGIDFPRQENLIAWGKTCEEIAHEIGADGVIYNSIQDLEQAIKLGDLCTACLKGKYPTGTEGVAELQSLRLCNLTQLEVNLTQLEATCKP